VLNGIGTKAKLHVRFIPRLRILIEEIAEWILTPFPLKDIEPEQQQLNTPHFLGIDEFVLQNTPSYTHPKRPR
jgi:hypothetical protein